MKYSIKRIIVESIDVVNTVINFYVKTFIFLTSVLFTVYYFNIVIQKPISSTGLTFLLWAGLLWLILPIISHIIKRLSFLNNEDV